MRRRTEYEPYIYTPGDAFPFIPRNILMGGLIANGGINRNVFGFDELEWIDGKVNDLMADSSVWVDVWTTQTNARAASLKAQIKHSTKKDWLGHITTTTGYWYNSDFLAWFQVRYTVMKGCLLPVNRPAFARELRARPFETEVLRGNNFTASAIAGVLAETPGAPGHTTGMDVLVPCSHCKKKYGDTVLSCPWCGAPR